MALWDRIKDSAQTMQSQLVAKKNDPMPPTTKDRVRPRGHWSPRSRSRHTAYR